MSSIPVSTLTATTTHISPSTPHCHPPISYVASTPDGLVPMGQGRTLDIISECLFIFKAAF